MSRRSKNGGTIALICFAVLTALTVGAVVLFIAHDGTGGLLGNKEVPSVNVQKEATAADAADIIIESMLEPEVEVVEKSGSGDSGDEISDSEYKEIYENLHENSLNNYCYEHLNDEEKKIYTEIYGILTELNENILISSKDPDLIKKVFSCVMLDHPEIFYVTGYSLTKYTKGDSIENITFTGKYTYSKDEVEGFEDIVERVAAGCVQDCIGEDEYTKVKYVYEWLISRCDYELNAENNQNILSVFVTNKTVCQGYAKAAQYLLNKMGVFCILCEGQAMGSEAHVWNIVRIDGEHYYLDVTWGDATYTFNEAQTDFKMPDINYEYMCVPYDAIAGTHAIYETVTLPVCNSMRDNYYVREGVYFEDVDESRLRYAFDRAYRDGRESVSLKCNNRNVYEEMERFLIDREHIFDYLQGNSKVNYVKMQDRNLFLFYLE